MNVRDRFDFGVAFTSFIGAIFAFAMILALGYKAGGQLFPLMASVLGLALTLWQLLFVEIARSTFDSASDFVDIAVDDSVPSRIAFLKALKYFLWIVGFYMAIWLVGVKIAMFFYFVLFLRLEGKASWKLIAILTSSATYFVFFHFEKILSIHWPEAIIQRWLDLPWIF